MNKTIEKKCVICGNSVLTDTYGQGRCFHCNWYNDVMDEENENEVIFPNLVSFNKAKKLYQEGKPLIPDLNDFLDGFNFYGEMQFRYKDIECELVRSNNEGGISFCYEEGKPILFTDKDNFIKNAKIGNEFVRDIWDKVEDPSYM